MGDPEKLIPNNIKEKIEFSLKHKEEKSRLMFDCVAYYWHISKKTAPLLKEILSDLSENVDLEARNNHKMTVLMHAVYFGAKEAANRLIERGANVRATDMQGNSALHFAASTGNDSCCGILLESGADVNCKTRFGKTALMFAADHGRDSVVELLLASGADGNAQDENGSTALMEAAQHERVGVVKILLKFGVNAQMQNKSKFTAFDVAAKKCSDLIRDHEATYLKRKRDSKMHQCNKY